MQVIRPRLPGMKMQAVAADPLAYESKLWGDLTTGKTVDDPLLMAKLYETIPFNKHLWAAEDISNRVRSEPNPTLSCQPVPA